jgi:hypothetical protein
MNRRQFFFAVSIAAVVLMVAPIAFAGKGGSHGGGSGGNTGTTGTYTVTISPAEPYSFGEQVYATTNVPESLFPFIWMRCYQNGVQVGSSDHAAFSTGWYYNWPFSLGPSLSWTGGAADCTFRVVHTSNNKVVTDASTTIHVNA